MRTAQDLIDECNKDDMQLPYFTAASWLVVMVVGLLSGILGAMLYAYILSPILK